MLYSTPDLDYRNAVLTSYSQRLAPARPAEFVDLHWCRSEGDPGPPWARSVNYPLRTADHSGLWASGFEAMGVCGGGYRRFKVWFW